MGARHIDRPMIESIGKHQLETPHSPDQEHSKLLQGLQCIDFQIDFLQILQLKDFIVKIFIIIICLFEWLVKILFQLLLPQVLETGFVRIFHWNTVHQYILLLGYQQNLNFIFLYEVLVLEENLLQILFCTAFELFKLLIWRERHVGLIDYQNLCACPVK